MHLFHHRWSFFYILLAILLWLAVPACSSDSMDNNDPSNQNPIPDDPKPDDPDPDDPDPDDPDPDDPDPDDPKPDDPDPDDPDPDDPEPVSGFHVTVDGKATGDGSIEDPWDLSTAFVNTRIKPGDTLYLHGGIYRGAFKLKLNGRADNPIVIRSWKNDVVVIDGEGNRIDGAVLSFDGTHTWLSGVTITNSRANHYDESGSTDGVFFIGPDNKLTNSIIRDNSGNGIGFWQGAAGAEVSGCIIYHNGYIGPSRGHGHGLYVQNRKENAPKIIRNNIIFNSFGKGIQVYATGSDVTYNTVIEDNIFFNCARAAGRAEQCVYIGGVQPADNHQVLNNVFYASTGKESHASARFGDSNAANGGAVFSDNYCVDSFLDITNKWQHMTARNNTYIAKSSSNRVVVSYGVFANVQKPDYDDNTYYQGLIGVNGSNGPLSAVQALGQELNSVYYKELPAETAIFVKSVGADRWHVAVFNWGSARSVQVTVPGLEAGDDYILYEAASLGRGPVAEAKYGGDALQIQMSAPPVDIPVGMEKDAANFTSTLPDFGAYLVVRKR